MDQNTDQNISPSLHNGGVVENPGVTPEGIQQEDPGASEQVIPLSQINMQAPCACVEVVKAFAALPQDQRIAVHKALDEAVTFDKERASLGLDPGTDLYEKVIRTLNL
jgi:hypothetical protein